MHVFIHSLTGDNNKPDLGPGNQVTPGQLLPQQDVAISLNASLFELIDDRDDVGIFFALYDNSTLFPVDGGSNVNNDIDIPIRTEVGSHVLAATVGPGLDFPDLTDNIIIVFRLVKNVRLDRLLL